MPPFSESHGFVQPKGIRYRDELPSNLRRPIIDLAARRVGLASLLGIVAQVLDPYGIEPKPLVAISANRARGLIKIPSGDAALDSVRDTMDECPWYRVYDIVEFVHHFLKRQEVQEDQLGFRVTEALSFEIDINEYFVHAEIGWQLRDGRITARGDEMFEHTINTAVTVLEEIQRPTAAGHLRSAIAALSARPQANTSGAVRVALPLN
jgi:hypothetical protein